MNWIKITDSKKIKLNDKDFVLFVTLWESQNVDNLIVTSYTGVWEDVKRLRKYELHNEYTHYIKLPDLKCN
jgi:hypothetical protein